MTGRPTVHWIFSVRSDQTIVQWQYYIFTLEWKAILMKPSIAFCSLYLPETPAATFPLDLWRLHGQPPGQPHPPLGICCSQTWRRCALPLLARLSALPLVMARPLPQKEEWEKDGDTWWEQNLETLLHPSQYQKMQKIDKNVRNLEMYQ